MNKPQYKLTAVHQRMHPTLQVTFDVHSTDDVCFKVNALDLAQNDVMLNALSKKDAKRVHYFATLITGTRTDKKPKERIRKH